MNRREFGRSVSGAVAGVAAASASWPPAIAEERERVASEGAAPFKLSVMLWTVFRGEPLPQRLEKVAQAGYHAVEFVDEFKGWGASEFAVLRKKKSELGIEIDATCGPWPTLADPNDRDKFLAELKAFVPTMRELETTKLVMQTGNAVPGMSREAMHNNCIEALKRAGDIASQNNIELLVENIDPEENPKYFLMSCAEGFEIVRAVGNPHVKFLCDFFHEQIAEGNLIAKLPKNMDILGLVHVADVPGRHEPGSGEIHFPNIYRKLAELDYSRYIAMEFLPVGEPVAALREAREMALKFGAAPAKSASLTDLATSRRRSHATS
jgi:hydroxypyruvate isomerase